MYIFFLMFMREDSVRMLVRGLPEHEALVKATAQDHAKRGQRSFSYESQTHCSIGFTIVSTFPLFERLYMFKMAEV